MPFTNTKENGLESLIVKWLVEQNGYEEGTNADYNKEYAVDENDLNGMHAAEGIGMPPEQIFKTLVAKGERGGYAVFCIPVCCELDLKKAAKAAHDKKIELIHVKDLLATTGYIRGGCSPIGMKKPFPTYIDETAQLYDEIGVSAGCRGCQVLLDPMRLADYVNATLCDLTE